MRIESVALLPAAGASRRMGRPKLLLPVNGRPMVAGVVEALRGGGVREIVLVTAPGDEALQAWARQNGVTVAINPDPERGMLSTIQEGIGALSDALTEKWVGEILLISPADLPHLQAGTVAELLQKMIETGAPLALPTYHGKRGHPLAIAPWLVSEIDNLNPDIGLKQLRDRHEKDLLEIEVEDAGVVQDVDTPEDYERLTSGI